MENPEKKWDYSSTQEAKSDLEKRMRPIAYRIEKIAKILLKPEHLGADEKEKLKKEFGDLVSQYQEMDKEYNKVSNSHFSQRRIFDNFDADSAAKN